MKKLVLGTAVLAVLALVGCKKEQSELAIENIAGNGTVQGVVKVDMGYTKDGDNFVVKTVPAEGRTVVVKVKYTEYDADAAAGTIKVFEATCDAQGMFKVNVPVGLKPISAEVETRPFNDKYYEIDETNNTIIEKDAYYKEVVKTVSVENGKISQVANITISKDIEGEITSRTQEVKINGVVKNAIEKKGYIDEKDHDKGTKITKDNAVAQEGVKVVVTFKSTVAEDTRVLVYNTTTNAEGEYVIDAKLFSDWDMSKITVDAKACAYLAEFAHYYQEMDKDDLPKYKVAHSSQTVTGYYDEAKVAAVNLSAGDLLIGKKLADAVMTFVPDYNNNKIFGITNGEDYNKKTYEDTEYAAWYKSENLYGWSY